MRLVERLGIASTYFCSGMKGGRERGGLLATYLSGHVMMIDQ